MKEPFGYTIFCDDIRDEIFNKKTFVGVYQNELVIPGPFPFLLPTFGFSISYIEPMGWPAEQVQLKVTCPGQDDEQVVIDADIPTGGSASEHSSLEEISDKFRAHIMNFKISPLVIFKEGPLKVRAYAGGREIRLGSLNVRIVDDGEREKFGWPPLE